MALWPTKKIDEDPAYPGRADLLEAYKEGRKDERLRVTRDGVAKPEDKADAREVYERGRRDERARRRGSPMVAFLMLIAAAAGGTVLYLAVREGSFSNGGAVVDRTLSTASETAQAPIRNAADKTGNALENAGQNLKENAGSEKP